LLGLPIPSGQASGRAYENLDEGKLGREQGSLSGKQGGFSGKQGSCNEDSVKIPTMGKPGGEQGSISGNSVERRTTRGSAVYVSKGIKALVCHLCAPLGASANSCCSVRRPRCLPRRILRRMMGSLSCSKATLTNETGLRRSARVILATEGQEIGIRGKIRIIAPEQQNVGKDIFETV
jgi:hypothetical protein